jgi:hypothetical protein
MEKKEDKMDAISCYATQQSIDEMADKLNLPKKFPHLFNKNIFRAGMFTILAYCLFILVMAQVSCYGLFDKHSCYGLFDKHISVSCKEETPCLNLFFYCNQHKNQSINMFAGSFINCIEYNKLNCLDDVCEKEYIQPGETIGIPPPKAFETFVPFVFCISALCLIISILWGIYRKDMEAYNGKKNL